MQNLSAVDAVIGRWCRGAAYLWRGARRSRPIGQAPNWDAAAVFNGTASLTLVIALCLAILDAPITLAARASDPDLTALFRVFTDLAKSDWMFLAAGAAMLAAVRIAGGPVRKARIVAGAWAGVLAFSIGTVAVSGILVNVLKALIGRGRPRIMDAEGTFVLDPLTFGYAFASFPSGHATTAFALAAAVALMAPRLRTGIYAIAAIIALSRVVVGAHYLSDVLAGAALGIASTHALAAICQRRGLVFAVRQDRWTLKAPRTIARPLRGALQRKSLTR